MDVIPTLAQLAGWRTPHAGLGHALLDPRRDARQGALCVRGSVVERIDDQGWVSHDLTRRIAASKETREGDLKEMELRLLAMYQVGHTLLLRNRVLPQESRNPANP